MEIEITKEEKLTLKQIHRSLRDGKKRDRIKAVLLLREGLKTWLKDEYKLYEGKLTNQEENQLVEYIDNNFISNSKQVIKYVRERFQKSYSMSGMVSLLHKLGFVYKQTTLIPSKYDPQAQKEFKEGYEKLYKELKADKIITFMDGVHPQHNTTCAKVWIKKGKEKQVKSNTGRSRINIDGIYNPLTQDILIREDQTINADSTIAFFKQIEEHYKDKSKIYIIKDIHNSR